MNTKRKRLLICLVAGVLILAVSATAAFGSVNGYTKYKEALKSLALETDNFTASGTLQVRYDDKEVASVQEDFAMDGQNIASHNLTTEGGVRHESYDTLLDGVRTSFNADESTYYQVDYGTTGDTTLASNLLGVDTDDEMTNRLVNFAEIAADTVVGELKNNFVQVGSENGVDHYQVEIAQNQVPSLINAGLSLAAYTMNQANYYANTVLFADYSATALYQYETTTGQTLPEEFKDGYCNGGDDAWYETYSDLLDQVSEVLSQQTWEEQYYDILENKGTGIVYVLTDGSYDYYPAYQDLLAAHPEERGDSLESYVGQDLSLEKVLCTFGVDDQGRLTDNQVEVTFTTTDEAGGHHTLVLSGEVTLTDYGTTTIQPLDVGDRTLITY